MWVPDISKPTTSEKKAFARVSKLQLLFGEKSVQFATGTGCPEALYLTLSALKI